ncbi:hypoxanthine phosphoribosyltransferase [Candidatus Peregrinibacteria bacterium HGW-Peregrinibacteria-1]|jgi:hypoxanthine phosphoribosyltransferase|nr:MAG: hypoxanthine phosphoribosyltransferase [Candidatus Peregrinibacteria bacterium HGW-Peregrinibacteria-1]
MKILYSNSDILRRFAEVGEEISNDYQGREVVLLGVLKGCTVFMSHLLVKIVGDVSIEFVGISSYGDGTESGDLRITKELDCDVAGKDVIIAEDIIDTGKTVAFVKDLLLGRGARSVEVAVFVNKDSKRLVHDINPKYKAFEYSGERFVVGFGFDYGEKYRNLPDVYEMDESDK